MAGSDTQIVEVAGIRTALRRIGTGPPVLVLHGGPGFDHAYLTAPLRSLAARRTLIFYDQPGSGETAIVDAPDAALIFRHCAALMDEVAGDGGLGLIAHSWGCLVAIGATATGRRGDAFDEGFLITPVPADRMRYDAASAALFSRIPSETAQRYVQLASEGVSEAVVELLLPYYLVQPCTPDEMSLHFDVRAFLAVTNTLGDFDLRSHLGVLRNCRALTTGHDFCAPELIGDVLSIAAGTDRIADSGHFPMHESPEAFEESLQTAFASA